MGILVRLDRIGQPPELAPRERLPVRLVVWMGILMSLGGLLWTGLAIHAGYPLAAAIPASYVGITTLNLVVLDRTHGFEVARHVQVAISLVLPFLFQLALGGFVASGAVMLWALLALVASLAFQSPGRSAFIIAAYAILACMVGLLDPAAARWAGTASSLDLRGTLYLLINVVMVGSMVGALAAFLDHLRRVHADELSQANDRIHDLNTALQAEVRRAEEAQQEANAASRAKSVFLANMSHELRTPLNAIIGYSELLQDEEDHQIRDDAGRITSAGRHLLNLVNDILDVAKVEAGKLELDLQAVAPHELTAELQQTLAPLFDQSGNRLVVDLDRAPSGVVADPVRLRQVLVNLLSNANKFTDQGEVRLTMWQDRDMLHLEVSDTGIGMTPEELAKVREPFQQADSSTTRTHGGTGLGLHLVEQLVQLMGGTLDIASEKGEGTQVHASLRARSLDDLAAMTGT